MSTDDKATPVEGDRLRQPLAPLRKVVHHGMNEYGVHTETLDCGHTIHRKQDCFGYTNAERRRCRLCLVTMKVCGRERSAAV